MWKNIIHCPLILFGTLLQFCSPMMPVVRTGRVSSMTRFMSTLGEALVLNPEETAVVFIEYQNEFTTEGGKLHGAVKECMEKTNMLENSAKLARVAREAGCTVIHAPIAFEPGHDEISKNPYGVLAGIKQGGAFINGQWGSDFHPLMRPQPGDKIVKGKSGLCAFESTNLQFLLGQAGAKNVILGGFLTNCCVESTMRAAYERGYRVYTLQDCAAATSIDAHEAALKYSFGMFSIPTTSTNIIAALNRDKF